MIIIFLWILWKQQTGLGLGMRRRERAKHKTTLRVCHVKEVWEASAHPGWRQASSSLQHWSRLCRHLTKCTALVHGCDSIGGIIVAVAAPVERGSRHSPSFCSLWCRDLGVLMQAVALCCPGPVLAGCRTWVVAGLGWAGLVGAPRLDRQAKCKARSAYAPCCD